MRRYKLFALGAWRFMRDIHTGALPDPFGMPKALIVSTARFEPHVARGDVLLRGRLPEFLRGLEHLGALLRVQQIHVVMPRMRSAFATEVREALRQQSRVTVVEVPRRYPHGDLRLPYRVFTVMEDRRGERPPHRTEDALIWILSCVLFYEMGDDLGVGLGGASVAPGAELLAQRGDLAGAMP
jgi:hypothetical protein